MKAFCALLLLSSVTFALAKADNSQAVPADPKRAERVPVVLRVRLISEGEGSKYLWPQVELVAVIKNNSAHEFPKRFEVAHYRWEPGIPAGVSTLYLERYNPQREDLWRLLGGSASTGVSHSTKQ